MQAVVYDTGMPYFNVPKHLNYSYTANSSGSGALICGIIDLDTYSTTKNAGFDDGIPCKPAFWTPKPFYLVRDSTMPQVCKTLPTCMYLSKVL